MSNIIKTNYFHVNVGKKVIDSDVAAKKYAPKIFEPHEETGDGFVAGLNAPVLEPLTEDEEEMPKEELENKEELFQKAQEIIENAEAQAQQILENAKAEAEVLKNQIFEEAKQEGYQQGLIEANQELTIQKEKLEQHKIFLEEEYEQMKEELEPGFVDIVIKLVEKITGVIANDKKDVVLRLMKQSLKNIGRSKEISIHVSSEDFPFVEAKKESLSAIVAGDCRLDIFENHTLEKNQCMIEADNKIIDCSLDVQLKALTEDLKLLARH